jgi:hypothetical protein
MPLADVLGKAYESEPTASSEHRDGDADSRPILSKNDYDFFENGQRFVEVVNNNSQSRLVI